jgi:hypothetical protein
MRANSPFLTPYSPKGETLLGMIWTKTVTKFRTNQPCLQGLGAFKTNINFVKSPILAVNSLLDLLPR